MRKEHFPSKIRVSVGSAVILGLVESRLDAAPTTVYMLTYKRGKCSAACAFCPQSRKSYGRADMLSRVVWPAFETKDVVQRISGAFRMGKIKRACLQALNYKGVQDDLVHLAAAIHAVSDVPISVSCQPLGRADMSRLLQAGVERVDIALDAVTEGLFEGVKGLLAGGPYSWTRHFRALKEAVEVFGENHVTTHLIAGLGESEDEFMKMVQTCMDLGVYPAVFAFTPIAGTGLADHPPPPLSYYRRLQVAHYLVTQRKSRYEEMKLSDGRLIDFGIPKNELASIVKTGEPFRTSGCPGCNRPFYNERPGGPIYNYAWEPSDAEITEIKELLGP